MNKENNKHTPNKWGLTKYNGCISDRSALDVFHDEFDSFMERAFNWAWSDPIWVTSRNYRVYDVKENDDNYTITLEIPGYKREEIKLETINSSIQLTAENSKGKYVKSWRLSDSNLDKVTSKLEDGVLTINVPKSPTAVAKSVTIE
jgi:HSP20 family protein